jgi:hypothetical protein
MALETSKLPLQHFPVAGEEGFEPPVAVLETAALPLGYTPITDTRVRSSRLSVDRDASPGVRGTVHGVIYTPPTLCVNFLFRFS